MLSILASLAIISQDQIKLPPYPLLESAKQFEGDFLIDRVTTLSKVYRGPGEKEVTLDNGLVRRTFRFEPNGATVSLKNLKTGESFLRAVKPEALLKINGKDYEVGGLKGQPNLAFLKNEWLDQMTSDPEAFQLFQVSVATNHTPVKWEKKRHSEKQIWPPRGMALKLRFTHKDLPGLIVTVEHEAYDGIPVFMKRLVITNSGDRAYKIDSYTSEVLGVVETESDVEDRENWAKGNLGTMTDYSFHGMTFEGADKTSIWEADKEYATQVNYKKETPCLFRSSPPIGPGVFVTPGRTLTTHRSFLILHDSDSRERQSLTNRKFFRTLSPWATENPLMLHLTTTNPEEAKKSIDQAAEVGFEMVIFSFGSGLNMEDDSPANISKFKNLADYAHSKGLEIGGYSLLASRSIDAQNDVINPKTSQPGGAIFGNSPCLASSWGQAYMQKVQLFMMKTGFDLLEHDGSYPGDVCASTTHPGHQGLEDSQWIQWREITALYRFCREQGIYLNVPDWYILNGSNKTGMGYRETNWSLPREQQHIHARQNMFDGTWSKLPTNGWMFVPLTQYHGGGEVATIEPLSENLKDYERHLQNYLGFGVQACYRGPRLYDTDKTKETVIKWVDWYKSNREILESDVIHLKRADAQSLDCILHVNPKLQEKGMLVVWNPLNKAVKQNISVPLYYSGIRTKAMLSIMDKPYAPKTLGQNHTATIPVDIPAKGFVWVKFRQG